MQLQSKYQQVFVDIDKLIVKFIRRGKRPRIVHTLLKEKNNIKGLILTDFKNYYEATGNKPGGYR